MLLSSSIQYQNLSTFSNSFLVSWIQGSIQTLDSVNRWNQLLIYANKALYQKLDSSRCLAFGGYLLPRHESWMYAYFPMLIIIWTGFRPSKSLLPDCSIIPSQTHKSSLLLIGNREIFTYLILIFNIPFKANLGKTTQEVTTMSSQTQN